MLAAWYIIRPVREQMGVQAGVEDLNYLFLGTLAATLLFTPIYGALVHLAPRRVILVALYSFLAINLIAFTFVLRAQPEVGPWTARLFYVWASAFNLFVMAAFTSLMADVWTLEQAKRVFGGIAVGGTAGAILGSTITATLTRHIGQEHLPLASAAFLVGAIVVLLQAERASARAHAKRNEPATDPAPSPFSWKSLVEGVTMTARSPYLLGIAVFMLCQTITGSFFYFQQARIVDRFVDGRAAQTQLFASINLWTNILTIVVQIFLTGRVIRALGVGPTLLLLPIIFTLGFLALELAPDEALLTTMVVVLVATRASNFALSKPARETLFTVIPRNEKYKAKGFVDTFIYRGGDAIGAVADKAVKGAEFGIVWIALPITTLWGATAIFLGARQRRLAHATNRENTLHPGPIEPVDLAATPVAGAARSPRGEPL